MALTKARSLKHDVSVHGILRDSKGFATPTSSGKDDFFEELRAKVVIFVSKSNWGYITESMSCKWEVYVIQMGGVCHTNRWCMRMSQGFEPQRGILLQEYKVLITGVYFILFWKHHEHGSLELF